MDKLGQRKAQDIRVHSGNCSAIVQHAGEMSGSENLAKRNHILKTL
jgi:hypothetical protein